MLTVLLAATLLADSPPPGPQSAPAVVGATNILAFGAVPNDAGDDAPAIQAALDRAGRVIFPPGVYRVHAPLLVYSDTAIEATGATVVALSGINGPLLRNQHWISSYNNGGTPINDGSTILDRRISIHGGTWDHNRRGGAAPAGSGRLSSAGQYLPAFALYGVQDCTVEGVRIYDPCTYGIHYANAFDVTCRDVEVISPSILTGPLATTSSNTDGIHLNGPCARITIDNLRGATGDDFLAICADDGNLTPAANGDPNNNPAIYGGWQSVYCGPITQVSARTLRMRGASGSLSALRILSGTNRIDQIDVSDVAGQVQLHAMIGALFPAIPGAGNVGRVTLRDWRVGVMGNQGDSYAIVSGNWESLDLLNHQTDEGYVRGVRLYPATTIGRLRVERHILETAPGLVLDPPVSVEGSNIGLLEAGGSWRRVYAGVAPAARPFVAVDSASTVTDLLLDRLAVSQSTGLLNNAGTITALRTLGTSYRAGSGPALLNTGTITTQTGAANLP